MPKTRNQRTIINDLRDTTQFHRTLADEMCAYAAHHHVDIFDEFLNAEHAIPPAVLAAWGTEDARTYMVLRVNKLCQDAARPAQEKAEAKAAKHADAKARSQVKQAQQQFLRDLAVEVIGRHFVCTFEGNFQPYIIVDHEHETLEPMDVLHLGDQIAHKIKDELEVEGIILDSRALNELVDYWRFYAPRIEEPKVRRRMDDPGWCLSRPTIKPDPTMPCPTWDSVANRTNDAEALYAYIGGMYYHLNPMGRQVLYLSEQGQGAKTQWLLGLTRLMGERVTKSINAEQLKTSRFFSAACVKKAFVIVPDNMNPRIIMTGAFKEVTGHDLTSTEKKFQNPRDVKLEAKGIIIGNPEPDISGERHNYTRTLWLTLDGLPEDTEIDVHWPERLDAEAPGMLAKALAAYEKRCKGDYEIVTNAAVQAMKDAKVKEFEERFQTIFSKFFVIAPQGKVSGADMYEVLHESKDGPQLDDREIANFKRWMFARHHIERGHSGEDHFYTGLRQKGPKDRTNGGTPSTSDRVLEDIGVRGSNFTLHGYSGR